MKDFFYRITFLAILVFFQTSFLNILFPTVAVPVLIITAVVAWTLIAGFPGCLWMTVGLTVLYDCLTAGAVTAFSLYALVLSYATSFLSRRLMIERGGFGLMLSSGFAALGVTGYVVLGYTHRVLPARWQGLQEFLPMAAPALGQALALILFSGLLFAALLPLITRFEERLRLSSQKQFHGVK